MSRKGTLIAVAIVIIFVLLLCACCGSLFMLSSNISEASYNDQNIIEETVKSESTSNKIALIDIEGMIASSADSTSISELDMVDAAIAKLDKASNDDNVKAIIIRLDTPGGTVYDSDLIAQKVKEVKSGKPVIALMATSATSGGYYIAAPATKIVASEASLTGSIGVITQVVELDKLYEKIGVNVITITNSQGDVKSMQNLDDPNSEDREVLQKVLDDYYDTFVGTVAEGRNMSVTEVQKLADGSVYSGKEAQKLGLVDELGGLDKAAEIAKQEAGIDNAKIIRYKTYVNPWTQFGLFVSSKINPIDSITNKLQTEPGAYLYYLPE